MPADALIPGWVVSVLAMVAIFALMFELGATFDPARYRSAWSDRGLMLRALFCTLVAVPLLAVLLVRTFALPRDAQVGVVLMALAPGAPVALRRAVRSGADTGFAVALQVTLVVASVLTLPLSVAALDEMFAGQAAVTPRQLAAQALLGQGVPLLLGAGARHFAPHAMARARTALDASVNVILGLLLAVVLADVWRPVSQASVRVAVAIATTALAGLAIGHVLGGPGRATRTALAMASGARNTGLALLVATLNDASDGINAAILAYFVIAALVVTPYLAWRRPRLAR
ncbi:MAG TPA: hypothetical protein VFE23_18865 [Usitatibacter sp.]|jgi:BASS family bile acid:Na+ symporter|nr:hypothetical protein [Usitatibacter sp.]